MQVSKDEECSWRLSLRGGPTGSIVLLRIGEPSNVNASIINVISEEFEVDLAVQSDTIGNFDRKKSSRLPPFHERLFHPGLILS